MTGKNKPTDSELQILNVLWQLGQCTVREVHAELSKTRDIGYTTVLKLMQIMHEKNLVARNESKRSHVYRARNGEEAVQKQLLKDLINRAFGGSTEKLVMRALAGKKTSPEELARLRELLDEHEGENE
jgi:predicted transcriptional regulator